MVGVVFTRVYSDISMSSYREQLGEDAVKIAEKVSVFVRDDDYSTYPSFIQVLEAIEKNDILIMSNPEQPMNGRYANVDREANFPELAGLLKEVYAGRVGYTDVYSQTYEANLVFAGAPITLGDGTAVGAVIVSSAAMGQKNVINQSILVVISSVALALLFSGLIALWLARQITHPIIKMRHTAMDLAGGNYEAKTGIARKDEIGELAGTMDILSERLLEAENERKEMEQMRIDFFANVSHELRTPITVMRAYTETLIDGVVKDEEKKRGYYEKMLGECKSMERLVGDLLLLSKMQNPDFVIDKEPISLEDLLDDIARSAAAVAKEKGVVVKDNFADAFGDEVCLISGDYERLRQMFMIIVDNAVKFSNENGVVEILLERGEKEVTVSIRDHGIGISKEELPYIFDKFYKSKLRQNSKGSGLGLPIARQICYKHGGKLSVTSTVGEGTEFKFTFEVLKEDKINKL